MKGLQHSSRVRDQRTHSFCIEPYIPAFSIYERSVKNAASARGRWSKNEIKNEALMVPESMDNRDLDRIWGTVKWLKLLLLCIDGERARALPDCPFAYGAEEEYDHGHWQKDRLCSYVTEVLRIVTFDTANARICKWKIYHVCTARLIRSVIDSERENMDYGLPFS